MDIVDKYTQIVQGLFLSLFERAQHDGCLSLAGDKITVWLTLGMRGNELSLAASDFQINRMIIFKDFPPMSAARARILDQIVRVRLDSLV